MPNWAKIACSLRMTSVAVSFVAVSVSSKDVYRRVLRIVVHDDHGILAIGELAKSIDTRSREIQAVPAQAGDHGGAEVLRPGRL